MIINASFLNIRDMSYTPLGLELTNKVRICTT